MKRSKLLAIALTLLFVGCSPTQSVTEWKINPEYRGFVSTRMAEAIMQTPAIDEDEEDELCDGSGWIVHGDGHKTPCPGCDACEKQGGQEPEPVEITIDAVEDCPDGQCPTPSSKSQPERKGLLKRLFGR